MVYQVPKDLLDSFQLQIEQAVEDDAQTTVTAMTKSDHDGGTLVSKIGFKVKGVKDQKGPPVIHSRAKVSHNILNGQQH